MRYKIAQIHALSKQFYNVVKINIQIHALRREFLCICKANTDGGYAAYIYYNTIKCFAFNCYVFALQQKQRCIYYTTILP